MKNDTIYILLVVIFIGMTSCDKDYEMLTQINHDGSCIREFRTITTDSSFLTGNIAQNPFPFTIDSTWKIMCIDTLQKNLREWPLKEYPHTTSGTSEKMIIIATKKFATIEDMAVNFRFNQNGWQTIKPIPSLYKSFRWFYTYYTFTETYPRILLKTSIALDNYLNPAEQKIWLQGDLSSIHGMNGIELNDYLENIRKKFDNWINRNMFNENYDVIQYYKPIDVTNPFVQRLSQAKDSIFNANQENYDFYNSQIYVLIDQYFKTEYFSNLYKDHQSDLDSLFEEKLQVTSLFEPNFKYELSLPGKIISTNAPLMENDKLIWKLNAYRFMAEDYTITAQSRSSNPWAFIVTTFILLSTIIYFIRNKKLKY